MLIKKETHLVLLSLPYKTISSVFVYLYLSGPLSFIRKPIKRQGEGYNNSQTLYILDKSRNLLFYKKLCSGKSGSVS